MITIVALRAVFHIHGCRSLKEKRQRLAKLRDKFGKHSAVAVCESDYADELRKAEWTFVVVAGAGAVVEQILADIERYLTTALDAEVISLEREWLG